MPLIVICGGPCSGKSTIASQLVKHFSNNPDVTTDVHLVSDQSHYESSSRDLIYGQAANEKRLRAALKDDVTRNLSDKKLVVIDAMNYIKG